jgi:4-amino-4-deoxy-L-arabinose transferase-like glycosyltransferase
LPASTDVSQATQDKSKHSSEARFLNSVGRYWLAAIFALALAVRLWFAFADGHSSLVYSCDASEYLRDANGLAKLLESSDRTQIFCDAFKSLSDRAATEPHLSPGFEPVKELAIAGPIFPLFLVLSHAAFGLPITQLNWQAPVLFQCILTSLTCVLIAWIGKSAWRKDVGITAGIISALYPGFIVNSVRMYSESFSCFLLCAVVALTIPVLNKSGMFHSVSTGILLAFLQLTRSVMVLVTGITFALTTLLSTGKSRILRLAGLVAGLAIVFAPWLLFQQLAFHKSSVVVDRVGHYNLFVGTNITTQGYLSYPYPDGGGIEKKSYGTLVGAQIKESPERFARLMLDKPLRLYKFPWNDFRTPIGPIGINAQVLFHQIALAFAAVGLTLCLLNKSQKISEVSRLRLTLVALWAMHCVYLVFITVPRYNLTSIPFLVLFAAAGLTTVVRAISSPIKSLNDSEELVLSKASALAVCGTLALSMICARIDWSGIIVPTGASLMVALIVAAIIKGLTLSAFFILLYRASAQFSHNKNLIKLGTAIAALIAVPICSLPLKSNGRFGETQMPQQSGAVGSERTNNILQTIAIPDAKRLALGTRDCYLLIDCENWQAVGNDAQITVNGVALTAAPVPLMPFTQALTEMKSRGQKPASQQRYLECEDIYSSLTSAAGGGNLDIRQWFAIAIPPAVIDSVLSLNKRSLEISIKRNPSVASAIFASLIDRSDTNIRIPSIARFSWEKAFYGVEIEDGFTDSRYDDKISIESGTNGDTTNQKIIPNIRLLIGPTAQARTDLSNTSAATSGPLSNASAAASSILSSTNISSQTSANGTAVGQSKAVLNEGQLSAKDRNSLWLISVNGKFVSDKSSTENIPVSFSAIIESVDKGVRHRYRSPWVPTSMVSPAGTSNFQFAFPFQPSALPGKLTNVSIESHSGGPASKKEYFSVNNQSTTRPPAGSLGASHRVEALKLEINNLPSNPIGIGYEVL